METEHGTDPLLNGPSTDDVVEVGGPGPESEVGATPTQQQPTGINPAWAPLQEALGEDYFATHALPVLKGMDEAAQTRITNLNSQVKSFDGYKPFVEQGIAPDDIQMAMQLRQLIQDDPAQFYTYLGEQLGLTPEQQEDLEEFGAGQDDAVALPPHIMARLDAAEQFQQQQIEAMQQQQMEAQQAQAIEQEGARLDQDMSAFLTGNPTYTEEDRPELFRLQYELTKQLEARGLNRMATLEEAAAALQERTAYYRQRGAGAGAPNTLPTTTGGAIPGQKPDVAKMSKQEFQDLLASDLLSQQAQS